ncbi:Ig-like domain-containing protein [Actinoplanes sp. RD1]|uniref:Ig-like domain-containing protein n=1 Tax=Actinoplanes sp. RD1 TaxID=3064538 RepID=UPI002740E130|nr:Ig-like domain-containing protein [Actinoplanes sp. RD1]
MKSKNPARRMLAGLAAVGVTAVVAAPAPAQAAAVRPLAAGATTEVTGAPGSVVALPLSATNTDTVAVDGAVASFGFLSGFRTDSRFSNCAYDVAGNVGACEFDQVLEPGKTYGVALPVRVPADAYAPGELNARFEWMTSASYAAIGGDLSWTRGDGETLRLVETAPAGARAGIAWQYVDIQVTGAQGADLVAMGAKVSGGVGDVVQLKAGVRNNGPATIDWTMTHVSPAAVFVTIPPGTSVDTAPAQCSAVSAKLYECEGPVKFGVGTAYTFAFGLKIDQVIPGATGSVEVNPACQCQRFADDLDKSNDTAELVVNPLPTGPGQKDTNPPVVTSTGLTDGQWLGRYAKVVPAVSDDVAVTKVQVLVDGVVTETYEDRTWLPEVWVVPPTDLHMRQAKVTIRAFDAAGNSGERTTPVTVDVLSPDATITPAAGTTLSGTVTFRATNVSADTARVELLDPSGKVVARTTAAPWTMTWNTRGYDGNQAMAVHVIDRADNARFFLGNYRVDNAGPVVTSITPANRALVRGSVRTTVKASDPSGVKSAVVTGGKATSTPLTWTVTPKAQGAYTIEWKVTDKLGNVTVARRVVVNDTVAPALKFLKAPKNNAKLTKKTSITASATDKNGVSQVQLLVNGKVVATDAKAGYSFTLDPKKYGKKFSVQLRAYDKAGNVKTLAKRTYRR